MVIMSDIFGDSRHALHLVHVTVGSMRVCADAALG